MTERETCWDCDSPYHNRCASIPEQDGRDPAVVAAGHTWDHPNADPLGDIQAFIRHGQATLDFDLNLNGYALLLGAGAYDRLTEVLGREPTVADIPAGVPGRWTAIVRCASLEER